MEDFEEISWTQIYDSSILKDLEAPSILDSGVSAWIYFDVEFCIVVRKHLLFSSLI